LDVFLKLVTLYGVVANNMHYFQLHLF